MTAEPDVAVQPLVEALRKKVNCLEGELNEAHTKIEGLEEENRHLRNRIERIEGELGMGGDEWR